MKFSEDQQAAFDTIMAAVDSQREIALSGPAGSGKTFLLGHIINALEEEGHNVIRTAPTHQACRLIKGAKTIHSALGLKLEESEEEGKQILRAAGGGVIGRADVLVVDEAAMIDHGLLKLIRIY